MRYTILHEQANPSTAYFLEPLLRRENAVADYLSFGESPTVDQLAGATVVIVRYVSPTWRRAIESARDRINRLVYFMDDDLWDVGAWQGLPLRYRWKLFRRAFTQRIWLDRMGAERWASSAFLAKKYAARQIPLGVPDADCFGGIESTARDNACLFYHGSASHRAEADWLFPVVRDVLAAAPAATFEIIAAGGLARRYRALDRVRVVKPMPWPAYQGFCRSHRRSVGLAPALDGAFNRARSPVKYFDIARAGGVGLYSADTVFDAQVDHGVDGLLLTNDCDRWVEAIVGLLADDERRATMRRVGATRIAALANRLS